MGATEATAVPFDTFTHDQFGSLRIIKDEETGKPWFVARDVAEALGYSNARQAVIDFCKGGREMRLPTRGGMQAVKIIPKADVYRLIIRSHLPAAEKFESWVFDEVLVSIDEHGGYGVSTQCQERYTF